jgi:hypothetical protein
MRLTPRLWLAPLVIGIIPLLATCAGSSAKSVTIPIPTASSGAVTLTPDRPSYTTHQPIGITVANTGKTPYYAKDGLSACTYIQLEWYDAAKQTWTPVDGCTGVNTPAARLIAPNSSLPYTLAPGDSPTDANAWVAGVYRVALTFSKSQDLSGSATTAYSTGFQVSG